MCRNFGNNARSSLGFVALPAVLLVGLARPARACGDEPGYVPSMTESGNYSSGAMGRYGAIYDIDEMYLMPRP
jgi:hypothetical protein